MERVLVLMNCLKKLYNKILNSIKNKEYLALKEFKYDDFFGLYFKTRNNPIWKSMINSMIELNDNNEELIKCDVEIENISSSYILFYIFNGSIYICTGGYGSTFIKKYTELHFGLYLVPKLVSKNDSVVKRILENNITGNRASTHYSNRDLTDFLTEENMGNIYKEMNIEIDIRLAKEIGILFDPNENRQKKITLANKDSITINRTLGIKELKKIIKNINQIESRDFNFVLSYFVPVKKIEVTESELTEELVRKYLIEKEYDSISIVGEEFDRYYFNAARYIVKLRDGNILLDKNEPITMREILDELVERNKFNVTNIKAILKRATISTFDESGNESLQPIQIFKVIQGLIDYKGDTYYIFGGEWYIFNGKYSEVLDNQFEDFNLKIKDRVNYLVTNFDLIVKSQMTENEYNMKFLKNYNDKYVFGHTTSVNNIEVADILFWDDSHLYLMCNKHEFSGVGARDLTNQILTSAELVQKMMLGERTVFISKYFKTLQNKATKENIELSITEDHLNNLFNKKICYVAGFINEYRLDKNTIYGKYLVYDLYKSLKQRGFDLIALNLYND